jgi:putative transferase (TIGR04331 family)
LNGIDKNIKDNLFLRPYDSDCLMTNDYFKNKYKFTHVNYYKGLLDSKLIISTYNSTTFLECFAVNVPCLLFWEDKEWLLNDKNYSHNDFSILKKNNILFNDPIKLSKFINKNYSNIETWWYGEKVQNIIKDFRNKYIYSEN